MTEHRPVTPEEQLLDDASWRDLCTLDAIATLLGTSESWDAEVIQWVADLVGEVRPHPNESPASYAVTFYQATGRYVVADFDQGEKL